jgi:glycosyltransferase involved in cell wall biosynthesis
MGSWDRGASKEDGVRRLKPFVAFLPAGLDACGMYRMFLPHLHMPRSVFLFQAYGMQPDKFAHCQVAMMQRLASKQNYEAMTVFKKMGIKIVYDLDDDMWSVPSYNPAAKVMRSWLPGFQACAQRADLVTVSTEHLRVMVKRELGKGCPRIEVIENALDFNWFQALKPEQKRGNVSGRVTVGWAGTNTHSGDLEEMFKAIPELLKELPEMDFEVAGIPIPASLVQFGDRVRQRDFVPIAEFGAYWPSWQWDIALAPLEENKFNLSKSNIKMIEAAALKIPCIVSGFGEYQKFCMDSRMLRDTILVKNKTGWKDKIYKLVKDWALRQMVGEEMYKIGSNRYNMETRVLEWERVFSDVVGV